MIRAETNAVDAQTLALMALVWVLEDEDRAARLLALTGLDAEALRNGIGDDAVLDGVLGFLESHEPDLIACAASQGVKPEDLVEARRRLGA